MPVLGQDVGCVVAFVEGVAAIAVGSASGVGAAAWEGRAAAT